MGADAPTAPVADLRILADQCLGCAVCADVCPTSALEMLRDDLLPRWNASLCTVCRNCQRECPTGAVEVR